MPNIREYNSNAALQGFGVSGAGAAAVASGGRAVGALNAETGNMIRERGRQTQQIFDTVGEVFKSAGDFLEHKEAMKFSADMATVTNQAVTGWNEARAKADPNDPAVAQRYNEEVLQPMLHDFAERYHTTRGQEMVANATGQLMEHLNTRQMADAATMAGEAAVRDLATMADNNAATLVNDPSSLEFVNKIADEAVDNAKSNPLLNEEQRAHLDDLKAHNRTQNTLAAFHGMAEKNPEAAEAALAAGYGKDDLNASQRIELTQYAKAQVKLKEQERKSAVVEQRQQEKVQSEAAGSDLVASMVKPDGSLAVPKNYFQNLKEIASLPGTTPGMAESLLNLGRTITKETEEKIPGTNDPYVQEDFSRRMLLSPDDPKALSYEEIYKARADGKLSNEGLSFYKDAVTTLTKDPAKRDALSQFNKFIASQKSSITQSNPLLGKVMPQQDQRFGQYQVDMRHQFDEAYKAGNWRNLIDPSSANYLGKQTQTYAYTNKQGLQVFKENLRGGASPATAVLPREPGETPEAYVSRSIAKKYQDFGKGQ